MTNLATLPPPPAEAEANGAISGQPVGAASQQMLPSGEIGGTPAPSAIALGGTAPAQASSTLQTGAASAQGIPSGLAQTIALAISLGLASPPTTAAGWAQLADYYSTSAGENQINTAEQGGATAGLASTTGQASPAGTTSTSSLGTNAFLSAIRQHESNGNYRADSGDGAYGAYQFIPSTWNSEAAAAGYSQYANGRADQAPPAVQDAVAAHMANSYFSEYGSWEMAARAWYDPGYVNDPTYAPPGNNGLTIGAYGNDIVSLMGQQPQLDSNSPVAGATNNIVKIASSQIGTPYVWGGEDPNAPGHPGAFDCSGLVQWVYGQAGVNLPRVAQAQYDATPKVAKGEALAPGDLLFFGSGPNDITHVGIYIGNNQMIDAPHTGADVRIDANPTQWANYVGATRPGDPGGASTVSTSSAAGQAMAQSEQNYGEIYQNVTDQLAQLNQTYPGLFSTTQAVIP